MEYSFHGFSDGIVWKSGPDTKQNLSMMDYSKDGLVVPMILIDPLPLPLSKVALG